MSLPGFTIFHLPSGRAHLLRSVDDIPKEASHGLPSIDDWHHSLAAVLPAGTRWIASLQAVWQGTNQTLRLEIGPDLRSAVIEATRVWEGEVLATFRRMRDTGAWAIVSLQTGELFDFDRPQVN